MLSSKKTYKSCFGRAHECNNRIGSIGSGPGDTSDT